MEWIGLVLLVALLVLGMLALAGARLPGVGVARTIAERLVCAVGLTGSCDRDHDLVSAYGAEVAGLLEGHSPEVRYESGMRALPVDFRRCREDACAEGPESGEVVRTDAGEPVVAFVHPVDCRLGGSPAGGVATPNCSGIRRGNLYLQYWFYYPGSATGEGSGPLKGVIRDVSAKLGKPSFHPDDWESYQLRIARAEEPLARASAHHGYNHSRGLGNVPSEVGLHARPGWGPATGSLSVSGGSHAGAVRGGGTERVTPAGGLELIPLDPIAPGGGRRSFAVTPPWSKRVWRDPEAQGTD